MSTVRSACLAALLVASNALTASRDRGDCGGGAVGCHAMKLCLQILGYVPVCALLDLGRKTPIKRSQRGSCQPSATKWRGCATLE